MSLIETRELMETMKELISLLGTVEAKTDKINNDLPKTKNTLGTFRELERVVLRYLVLARKIGVSDDVNKAIDIVSRLILLLTMAQMSMNMLMRGTPAGVLMGIAGVGMTALSMGNPLEGY